MRFGSHTHEPEKVDIARGGRDGLVASLRQLADRIERAPQKRVSEALASMEATAAAMARLVEQALGPDK